jgi:hypothetical protein
MLKKKKKKKNAQARTFRREKGFVAQHNKGLRRRLTVWLKAGKMEGSR